MQTLKKLPLLIGFLLMIAWGASKKVYTLQKHNAYLSDTSTLLESNLEELTQSTYATWGEFYKTTRPKLSKLITDQELKHIYHFLHKEETEEDQELTENRKSKLEALLILFTLKPSS